MLKNKKKKIVMIPLVVVLLIILFFVIRMIVCPGWLSQSVDNISKVHISSEFLDLESTDQEMINKLYELCDNTEIRYLEFDTSHRNANMSDGFSIDFIYKNNSSDTIDCKMNAMVLKEPPNALFWTRGEANKELLSLLLEIELSENTQIKEEQEQIFIEAQEYLKEYEQNFDKIISLAKADKSAQKEDGSGYISLTENRLSFSNSELEEHCLLLMKKTKITDVSFGQGYVSFGYESKPSYISYIISIVYIYNGDKEEVDLLWKVVKKIKPNYYMNCFTRVNE